MSVAGAAVAFHLAQPGEPRLEVVAAVPARHEPFADRDGDLGRLERAERWKQPLPLVVALAALAEHQRAVGRVEQLLLDLRLDQRALLLDDEDQLEPFGETAHALLVERPRHRDLVDPEADLVGAGLVDAERVEGGAGVEVALARRDDADPGVRAART